MNPPSIVDQLEPLRLPEAVSWWPLAIGWWVLILLTLAVIAWGLYQLYRRYRRGAPLRDARATVDLLVDNTPAADVLTAELARLRRRLAIAIAGRENCAGLTGPAWTNFLNELTRSDEPCFDGALLNLPHQPEVSTADGKEFLRATQRWIAGLELPK